MVFLLEELEQINVALVRLEDRCRRWSKEAPQRSPWSPLEVGKNVSSNSSPSLSSMMSDQKPESVHSSAAHDTLQICTRVPFSVAGRCSSPLQPSSPILGRERPVAHYLSEQQLLERIRVLEMHLSDMPDCGDTSPRPLFAPSPSDVGGSVCRSSNCGDSERMGKESTLRSTPCKHRIPSPPQFRSTSPKQVTFSRQPPEDIEAQLRNQYGGQNMQVAHSKSTSKFAELILRRLVHGLMGH